MTYSAMQVTWFNQAIAWVSANQWIVTVPIAAAGLVLRFLLLKKASPEAHLRIQGIGRGIVTETTADMPFKLRDNEGMDISNVYVAMIRFWNGGRRELRAIQAHKEQSDFVVEFQPSARILGGDYILSNADMRFNVRTAGTQALHIEFDGFNPDEWVVLSIFFTGDPQVPINVQGRTLGQSKPYNELLLEEFARPKDRAGATFLPLLFLAAAVAFIATLSWLTVNNAWSFANFFPANAPPFPWWVYPGLLLMPTLLMPLASSWLGTRIERAQHPKDFPMDADFDSREVEKMRAVVMTALTGKKYRVSNSIHNYGKIVIPVNRTQVMAATDADSKHR